MTTADPRVLLQSTRLLQALIASSQSVPYQELPTTAPTAILSRDILLRDMQQMTPEEDDRLSSPLQAVSFSGRVEAAGESLPPPASPRFSMRTPSGTTHRCQYSQLVNQLQDGAEHQSMLLSLLRSERSPKAHSEIQDEGCHSEGQQATSFSRTGTSAKKINKSPRQVPATQKIPLANKMSSNGRSTAAERHWEDMYVRLLVYKSLHGDCLVPKNYEIDPQLGKWVSYQRKICKTLKLDRQKRLQDVGFVFCLKKCDSWEVMFRQLEAYQKKHGHCLVPQMCKENMKLGKWVAIQRFNKHCLTQERKDLLNTLGFVWSVHRAIWDSMFKSLVEFKVKNGHVRVPYKYKANPKLANWVRRQKQNKACLSADCVDLLTTIGFEF